MFLIFLKLFGPSSLIGKFLFPGGVKEDRLQAGTTQSFTGSGTAAQANTLTGTISVTVVRVFPNGNLEVKGERKLSYNSGTEFIRVAGVIRPEDISSSNTVSSTKVADAQISYTGTGDMNDSVTRVGWEDILLIFRHFKMKNKFKIFIYLVLLTFSAKELSADRIKDLVTIAGIRTNQLVGYGLVIGLAKTGDGSVNLTKQSIAAMISQFGVIANTADIDGSNSATVMVTATLPPFSKPGQTIDVTVSTIGKAKSLKGGTLLMTALKGADGDVYAIAQGNLVVGGLGVEGADGSSTIQGTPTVGRIPEEQRLKNWLNQIFLKRVMLFLIFINLIFHKQIKLLKQLMKRLDQKLLHL